MKRKGFTLIEVLVAIAILAALVSAIFGAFLSFNRNQALQKDASKVVATLEEARQLTIFSKESSQYGVHFGTDEVVLFKGSTYSSSDPENTSTKLHSLVSVSATSLNGGGDEVIFQRLTGETSQDGTVTLVSSHDSSETKVITIEKTGLIQSN